MGKIRLLSFYEGIDDPEGEALAIPHSCRVEDLPQETRENKVPGR
jgi:hypothetical protein